MGAALFFGPKNLCHLSSSRVMVFARRHKGELGWLFWETIPSPDSDAATTIWPFKNTYILLDFCRDKRRCGTHMG